MLQTFFSQGASGSSGLKGNSGEMGPPVSQLVFNGSAPYSFVQHWNSFENQLNCHLLSFHLFLHRVPQDSKVSRVRTDILGKGWDYTAVCNLILCCHILFSIAQTCTGIYHVWLVCVGVCLLGSIWCRWGPWCNRRGWGKGKEELTSRSHC